MKKLLFCFLLVSLLESQAQDVFIRTNLIGYGIEHPKKALVLSKIPILYSFGLYDDQGNLIN